MIGLRTRRIIAGIALMGGATTATASEQGFIPRLLSFLGRSSASNAVSSSESASFEEHIKAAMPASWDDWNRSHFLWRIELLAIVDGFPTRTQLQNDFDTLMKIIYSK